MLTTSNDNGMFELIAPPSHYAMIHLRGKYGEKVRIELNSHEELHKFYQHLLAIKTVELKEYNFILG